MVHVPEKLLPGRAVRFTRNGMTGTLVALRDGRAEVATDLGRILVDRAELSAAPAGAHARHAWTDHARVDIAVHYDGDALDEELDLHQRTVAEVEPLLSQFISRALLRGLRRIRIIHGKGSGKLRAEVQRILKGHPSVSRREFAPAREGSFGATIAWLR